MFYLGIEYIKYWIGSVKFSSRPLQENTVATWLKLVAQFEEPIC